MMRTTGKRDECAEDDIEDQEILAEIFEVPCLSK